MELPAFQRVDEFFPADIYSPPGFPHPILTCLFNCSLASQHLLEKHVLLVLFHVIK